MKTIGVIAALAVAAPLSASFELLLVSDNTDKVIHRFDSVTGTWLGSFGAGILNNPLGVTLNQSTRTAYVLEGGSSVVAFNYNSGDFVGSFGITPGATYMSANSDGTLNLVYPATTRVQRRSVSGALIQQYVSASGFNVQHGIHLNDGFFYVSTRTGDNRRLDQFNSATGAFVASFAWFADRMARVTGDLVFNCYTLGAAAAFEGNVFNGSPVSLGASFSTNLTSPAGVAVGHDGICYATGTVIGAPGSGLIERYDLNTSTFRGTFGTGILNTPTGMAIVVAPEPASLAALAMGLLLVGARRIRRGATI